ncbi:diguanylate cyclase [Tsukamurella sp. 1534]|uniref:GGDEF domain-containing protein n=1 Tax=Tsukamurella sp. 1534 TaxID=1151061 RepID=UPI000316F34E|nr:sensor domain-containing diguanylate cyclase [Tsukamurella sp. 1534]
MSDGARNGAVAARRAWRRLTDRGAWRDAGAEEYSFATESLRSLRAGRFLKYAIGSLAILLLPIAVIMQFNALGPQGVPARVVQFVASVWGFVLGVEWIAGPWPTVRRARWFLVLSDILMTASIAAGASPTGRVAGTVLLAMPGMFAAFFLGWRILLVHCSFAFVVITALTAYAVTVEDRSLGELFVFATPALITVVGLPVMIQVVVETGRRGVEWISREWYVDSLTGVYNRRGMVLGMRRVMARKAGPGSVVVSAILDLDAFKRFNDEFGHAAGDTLLTEVARRLNTVPEVLVARNGGDEFEVFAVRPGREEARRTVDRLCALMAPRGAGADARIAGSLGIVIARGAGVDDHADWVMNADGALYAAKRSAIASVVLREAAFRE